MAQTNIIELNGKRYDASDGTLLGEGAAAGLNHAGLRRAHRGRSMDIMPKHHVAAQTKIAENAVHKKVAPVAALPLIRVTSDITPSKKRRMPSPVKVVAAHQPQKSKILMRSAVKKPTFKMKESIKTQAPTEMAAAPVATIVPKASAYRLEPRRAMRAQSVARSAHIRRFAPSATHNVAMPVAAPQPLIRTAPRTDGMRPATRPARSSTHAAPAKPAEHHDIFEAAIAHASSHLEPAPKVSRRRNRWIHVTIVAFVFLSVGGAVTWANKANIEMHFASMHAGFHIVEPSYTPDGYVMANSVSANNGKATLTYHSGDASFAITEQASSWDSATLANSTVALQNSPQIMQTAGRDVYLYGNGNAMWVDGGVLYNLMANGSLSNSEIANIAASL